MTKLRRHLLTGFIVLLGSTLFAASSSIPYDDIASLPIQQGGRIKPLQSVAISSLLMIQEKQTIRFEGRTISPEEWIVSLLSGQKEPDRYPIFLIHHPDIVTLIEGDEKTKLYSFETLFRFIPKITENVQGFSQIEAKHLTPYQRELRQLYNKVNLYLQLKATAVMFENEGTLDRYIRLSRAFTDQELSVMEKQWFKQVFSQLVFQNDQSYFLMFPPFNHDQDVQHWLSMPTVLLLMVNTDLPEHPLTKPYHHLFLGLQEQNSEQVQAAYDTLSSYLDTHHHHAYVRAKREFLFNRVQPFYRATVLYLIGLFVLLLYAVKPRAALERWSHLLIQASFLIHTVGLGARMYIQGRPPVTNLYSSAVFVGWFAILLCLVLYRYFKQNVLFGVASVIGAVTLIIAHHLSLSGDTLEMMQAVLDSNFWLSTHVITITMGYSAVFLAGFIGMYVLIMRLFSTTEDAGNRLYKLAYVSVCVGLVLSFVGTVLGGIWADQSWGRFWGWDPKENGALMIVLWTAICLHARMAGVVQTRGFMQLCVIGNMITSFSWFGVNMLGVGLHSYGFMDSALMWLIVFNGIQLCTLLMGYIPARRK